MQSNILWWVFGKGRMRKAIIILKQESLNNFKAFMDYAEIPRDPLSIVIKTHNFLDQLASKILMLHMKEPEKILGSEQNPKHYYLSQKTNLLAALGYMNVGNVSNEFKALDDLRNKFAHKYNYKITKQDIEKFGNFDKEKLLIENLMSHIANLVGYFMSIVNMLTVAPFYNECCNRQSIFKNDNGFKPGQINRNYPKDFSELFMMTDKDWERFQKGSQN